MSGTHPLVGIELRKLWPTLFAFQSRHSLHYCECTCFARRRIRPVSRLRWIACSFCLAFKGFHDRLSKPHTAERFGACKATFIIISPQTKQLLYLRNKSINIGNFFIDNKNYNYGIHTQARRKIKGLVVTLSLPVII